MLDEYESFLIGVAEAIDSSDDIVHYGVKGMKWGVRKDKQTYPIKRLGPDHLEVTTRSGEKLTLTQNKVGAIGRGLAKISSRYRESLAHGAMLTISKADGTKVGEASLNHRRKQDELYLNWVGINKKHRGQGYASSVLSAAEEFGKELGVKRMLLEVPGNSPDARHIYSKMGFESTNRFFGTTNDIWGGLEEMEYRFDKAKHSIGGETLSDNPEDYELAHYGIKGMKWGRRRAVGSDGLVKKGSTKEYSDDAASAKSSKEKAQSKGVQSLSNDELRQLNERMNLEQNYTRMAPQQVNKGKTVVSRIASGVKAADEVGRAVSNVPGINNIPGMDHPAVKLGQNILRLTADGVRLGEKLTK